MYVDPCPNINCDPLHAKITLNTCQTRQRQALEIAKTVMDYENPSGRWRLMFPRITETDMICVTACARCNEHCAYRDFLVDAMCKLKQMVRDMVIKFETKPWFPRDTDDRKWELHHAQRQRDLEKFWP